MSWLPDALLYRGVTRWIARAASMLHSYFSLLTESLTFLSADMKGLSRASPFLNETLQSRRHTIHCKDLAKPFEVAAVDTGATLHSSAIGDMAHNLLESPTRPGRTSPARVENQTVTVAARMQSTLARAVAAAAAEPGKPTLPLNSSLLDALASCNAGALFGQKRPATCSMSRGSSYNTLVGLASGNQSDQEFNSLSPPPSVSRPGSHLDPLSLSALPSPICAPHGCGGSSPPCSLPLPPAAALPELALEHDIFPTGRELLRPLPGLPQMLTVLPGHSSLPRIANLKSGCSDGLMLLSATACIVARASIPESGTAKRARLS